MDKLKIWWLRKQRRDEEARMSGNELISGARMRGMSLCMLVASLLSISAFAADGDPVTVSGLLNDATPTVTSAMSSVWTLMTSNPISTFALGCAILAVGFRFIRKAIRVSHKA